MSAVVSAVRGGGGGIIKFAQGGKSLGAGPAAQDTLGQFSSFPNKLNHNMNLPILCRP